MLFFLELISIPPKFIALEIVYRYIYDLTYLFINIVICGSAITSNIVSNVWKSMSLHCC